MELKIKNSPVDIELCEMLGQKQNDFLVLCFDGVELEFFGTPYDMPNNRSNRQLMVDALNDKTKKSLWPKMWSNWEKEIRQQFKLPETTTEKDYRPVVSCIISRVCHAYSEHLHAAIGLFETLSDKIAVWTIRNHDGITLVEIVSKRGTSFSKAGNSTALVIVETVLMLLKDTK